MGILLSPKFWFNWRPAEMGAGTFKMFVGFLLILVISMVLFAILKKQKSVYGVIWRKLNLFSLSNLLIGAVLMFFSYELLPVLSARIWLLVWAIGMIVWLVFISRTMIKIPRLRAKKKEEAEFNKYIP
ncbi:hypothetical protein K8R32_05505 [bacterium]|nr:hypothetical protein [bacterium]